MLVHNMLDLTAHERPSSSALIAGDVTLTFADVKAASERIAAGLAILGVRRGDRVALLAENSLSFPICLFGILKAGAIAVPLNPTIRSERLVYLLNDCSPRILIADCKLAATVSDALAQTSHSPVVVWAENGLEPRLFADAVPWHGGIHCDETIDQDLAVILYTSGSTGQPKGVMLTHHNVCNSTCSISSYLGNVPNDVVLCVLPVSFSYGLFQITTAVQIGFCLVLERSFAYPSQVLDRISDLGATGVPGVPSLFARLLCSPTRRRSGLTNVRYISSAAAPLPPAHISQLNVLFPAARLFSMYGLTECTRVSYLAPEDVQHRPDSVGKAMPNCEVYIVDDRGQRVLPGQVGELVVRGSNVMRGYWGKPAETAQRLRNGNIPDERVLYTGDLFRMDDEGFLYFVARRDDVFKSNGRKIAPKEIEAVLYEVPDVMEAAVVGIPDPVDGYIVKACVVLREGAAATDSSLRQYCRSRLEPALVPKHVEVCRALPKTESGKVKRKELQALRRPETSIMEDSAYDRSCSPQGR